MEASYAATQLSPRNSLPWFLLPSLDCNVPSSVEAMSLSRRSPRPLSTQDWEFLSNTNSLHWICNRKHLCGTAVDWSSLIFHCIQTSLGQNQSHVILWFWLLVDVPFVFWHRSLKLCWYGKAFMQADILNEHCTQNQRARTRFR